MQDVPDRGRLQLRPQPERGGLLEPAFWTGTVGESAQTLKSDHGTSGQLHDGLEHRLDRSVLQGCFNLLTVSRSCHDVGDRTVQ